MVVQDRTGEPAGATGTSFHRGLLFGGLPAYVPRSSWPVLAAITATFGIIVIMMATGMSLGLMFGASQDGDGDATAAAWQMAAALASGQVAAVLLVLLAAPAFGDSRREVLAWRPSAPALAAYPGALALMLAAIALFSLAVWLYDPALLTRDLKAFEALLQSDAWWLALFAIAVGAPLFEELVFRGFLLSALARSRIGFAGASVVTTGAWTALHASYSLLGLIEVFAVGLFFCWLLWRTGSVTVPLFCHALYNTGIALALLLIGLPSPSVVGGG